MNPSLFLDLILCGGMTLVCFMLADAFRTIRDLRAMLRASIRDQNTFNELTNSRFSQQLQINESIKNIMEARRR